MFGALRLEADAGPIHLPAKVGSLLAYVLLRRGPLAREKLATLLWGDVPDEQARHSLRTALNHIRKELGGVIAGDRDAVRLDPSFSLWVDVWEFERRLASLDDAASQDVRLVDLYEGDLLADLYDDWIVPHRDRYCRQYEEVLLQATQRLRSQGEYGRAIDLARQGLARNPANERAHQHVMFCLAASGDRPAALRQYEACRRALRDELDVEPSAATEALLARIKQGEGQAQAREARLTNLPFPLTRFVGRTREIAQIEVMLGRGRQAHPESARTGSEAGPGRRLVTLTGAGGSGKSRLAIEVGRALERSYRDGVWWIDLEPVAEAGLVAQAVARPLGVRERPQVAIGDSLVDSLRPRELLLLLDNCEHLAAACARLAAGLLEACPGLTIVATSRVALGVPGEWVFQLPTLAVPGPGEAPPVSALRQFEAIELFLERVSAADPEFALTAANAADVVRVCTQLDGIPLAIELAAACTRVLSVEQMASRLVDRLSLPAAGSAARPRHRTLRATMDWSYGLLSETERDLLARLAVFAGGWTLAAAEEVCAGGRIQAAEVLDLLARLVDKSMVVVRVEGPEARYGQLETIRQYAAERLEASGDSRDARRRHARHFAALAERAERGLRTPEMGLWLRRLEADHDNFRAALSWSLDLETPETSLRFARALGILWSKRGYLREGRAWLEGLLARSAHAAPEHRAKALVPAGWFARVLGEYRRATALNEDALNLCRLVGDRPGLAEVLNQRGAVALYTCDFARARACFDESLALAQQLGERWARAIPLAFLAHTAAFDLDWDARAKASAEEALALFTEMDDRSAGAHAHIVLGLGAHLEGDDTGALAHLDQAVVLCRQAADQRQLAISVGVSSLILHFLGRWPEALPLAREALRTALDLGEKTVAAQAFQFLVHLARDQGHVGRAVRLMGYTRRWGESFGFRLAPMMRAILDPELEAMRAQLGEAAYEETWEAGRAMSEPQALVCALGEEA